MVKISGRLVEPADDKPRSGVTLTLHSVKNSSVVLKHATYRCVTGGNGEYSFNAAPGTYAVAVSVYGAEPERVGQIRVYSDSLPGNLNTFLMAPGESDLTPEIIRLVDSMRGEAVKAAESAKASEKIVTKSASDVAENAQQVASDKVVVAQNTQTVSTKAQQVAENTNSVSANTLSVAQMRDEVAAKTSMAQGAADTATQKAASAASHDAAAAEYARQAQEAAQATAGALIDGGSADLSRGVYPQPVMVGSTKRPTFWKVTKGGTVGGVDYGVGDTLIYTTSDSGSYYKIDNTESVTSVQGEKGAVTLTPEKIGADAAGTAAALVDQHAQKAGVHPISGISGLQSVLDSKYSQGNIVGSVSQSGGVPTGAIIQRGRNANGEFVRFADGTQICLSSQVISTTEFGTPGPNMTVSKTWTFPANFSSSAGVIPSIRLGSGNPLIAFSHTAHGDLACLPQKY
ncbi:prophage tail fiber N-terminal domain-containing protein [Plesiomonas shigelloides subsp. oncorhynchi]|nr:prophage tail fiber N-terminal domain-containing protein [Plesiomonas shigelloides]